MSEAIRKHKVTQAINRHRRSATVAAVSFAVFIATTAPSWAYVHNG